MSKKKVKKPICKEKISIDKFAEAIIPTKEDLDKVSEMLQSPFKFRSMTIDELSSYTFYCNCDETSPRNCQRHQK